MKEIEQLYCQVLIQKLREGGAHNDTADRNYCESLRAVGVYTTPDSQKAFDIIVSEEKWNLALTVFRMIKEVTIVRKYT